MEKSQCRSVQLTLHLQNEVFAKAAFLDDVKDNIDPGRQLHAWSFGSQVNPKQHAHLIVDFEDESAVTIAITYHWGEAAAPGVPDIRPPYLEDCAQWLSSFIQTEKVIADLQIFYRFDEDYSPKINLPFPLLTVMEGTGLTDAMVSGVAIRFQSPSEAERVIVERFANDILMSIYSTQELVLKNFSLDTKLEEFAPLINSLIRERKSQ